MVSLGGESYLSAQCYVVDKSRRSELSPGHIMLCDAILCSRCATEI
jgi:hypothetical protein